MGGDPTVLKSVESGAESATEEATFEHKVDLTDKARQHDRFTMGSCASVGWLTSFLSILALVGLVASQRHADFAYLRQRADEAILTASRSASLSELSSSLGVELIPRSPAETSMLTTTTTPATVAQP